LLPSRGGRRGRPRRLATRLAAVVLAAPLAAGAPIALAQQTEQAPPQEGARGQQRAPQGGAEAAPELTERQFKDWLVRCGRPDQQGPEVCQMQQEQVDRQDRTVMAVAVGKVPGSSEVGLLILLPLGILLPAGVTMRIDDGAEIPLEVQR